MNRIWDFAPTGMLLTLRSRVRGAQTVWPARSGRGSTARDPGPRPPCPTGLASVSRGRMVRG